MKIWKRTGSPSGKDVNCFLPGPSIKKGGTNVRIMICLLLNNYDFKASIFFGYENENIEGTKDEFLTYLNLRKENFLCEVESMDFIKTNEDKQILIALMYLEIGLFEINIEHLDAIFNLEHESISSLNFKSTNS